MCNSLEPDCLDRLILNLSDLVPSHFFHLTQRVSLIKDSLLPSLSL
jgi:hypothetical protein